MHTCIGCLIVWLAHKNIENWYERRPNNNNDNQSVKCTKRVQGDIWCVDKGSPFVPCLPCPFVLSFYPITYCLSQVDPLHFLFLFQLLYMFSVFFYYMIFWVSFQISIIAGRIQLFPSFQFFKLVERFLFNLYEKSWKHMFFNVRTKISWE